MTHIGEDEVSIRELRQNLSVYLRRVQAGKTLGVTNRGRRVALLTPIAGASRLDHLLAEDRVRRPTAAWSDPAPSPLSAAEGQPLTDALLALREDDPR